MPKKSPSRYPVPKKPYAAFEPNADVSSTVTNKSNTGQSSSSTQTTGATGSISNKVNVTSVQGKSGAAGTTKSTTVTSPSSPSSTPARATPTTRPINLTGPTSAEVAANAAVSAARANANSAVGSALDRAGQQLAEARARAIEQMRSQGVGEEHIARLNQAFDNADRTIQEHKKRRS